MPQSRRWLPKWEQSGLFPSVERFNYAVHHCAWTFYQIRKIAGYARAGNAGKVFSSRRFQRKPLIGDPGMHFGTCVTHVPWCMSASFTRDGGEDVPGIPVACSPEILRIWQGGTWSAKHWMLPRFATVLCTFHRCFLSLAFCVEYSEESTKIKLCISPVNNG